MKERTYIIKNKFKQTVEIKATKVMWRTQHEKKHFLLKNPSFSKKVKIKKNSVQ